MRRLLLIALVTALALPAAAYADKEVVAIAPSKYASTTVTIDQGEPLTFRNSDASGPSHDVVSTANGSVRKQYLFGSDTVGNGKSSFVEGSQYLTTGTYDFYCSVHPDSMKGTITVTAAGTPKPRPGDPAPTPGPGGGPPPSDTTPPTTSLRVGTQRAKTAKRKRSLRISVGADEAAKLQVTLKVAGKRIARAKVTLKRAGSRKLVVRLGAKARAALKKGRRLTVVVETVDTAGNPGSATETVRLQ